MTRLFAIIAFFVFVVAAAVFAWPEQKVQMPAQAQAQTDTQAQGAAQPADDQPQAEEEKSYFLSFVENKLSAPNRRISISGISGVLFIRGYGWLHYCCRP